MATLDQQHLAVWLIQLESNESDDPEDTFAAVERSLQKITVRVAKLVTAVGCQALLARAIRLAAVETPFLRGVRAGMVPGASIEGMQESGQGVTVEQKRVGLVAVVAELIGLLEQFVGQDVTGRLVRDVWPDAPLGLGEMDPAEQGAWS